MFYPLNNTFLNFYYIIYGSQMFTLSTSLTIQALPSLLALMYGKIKTSDILKIKSLMQKQSFYTTLTPIHKEGVV